jgi:hypothetical protein
MLVARRDHQRIRSITIRPTRDPGARTAQSSPGSRVRRGVGGRPSALPGATVVPKSGARPGFGPARAALATPNGQWTELRPSERLHRMSRCGILDDVARPRSDLLSEIESGALEPSSDLPSLLRKCIALGGVTGSEGLRAWATLELKGYGAEDELPSYREVVAPLLLDGVSGYNMITGQTVPANMIPEFARDRIKNEVPFPQPIAELDDLLRSTRNRGRDSVELGPPGGSELVVLINADLVKRERRQFSSTTLPPTQIIERIYWSVSLASVARILDVVRTTLVELVAEMRAGTPAGEVMPSRAIAEQAVDIAIHGKRNRIVVQQAAHNEGRVVASGSASTDGSTPETPERRLMWWLVGVATIVTAVAAVWILFL